MLIFFIDCLTGAWLDLAGVPFPDSEDLGAVNYWMLLFLTAKGWFVFVPYLMIVVMMFRSIKFDIFDIMLTTVCIFSVGITQWDYYNNGNSRETGLDYRVFITIFLFIIFLKLIWKKLLKVILRVHR